MKKLFYLFTTIIFAVSSIGIVLHFPPQCTMKVKCVMAPGKNSNCMTPAKTMVIKLKGEFINSLPDKTEPGFHLLANGFLPYRNLFSNLLYSEVIHSYHSPPAFTLAFHTLLSQRC